MNNKSSITALMSAFGRAFHAEHAERPIFADTKAREPSVPGLNYRHINYSIFPHAGTCTVICSSEDLFAARE